MSKSATELSRLSKIVDKLMGNNEVFSKLDKDKFMGFLESSLKKSPSLHLTSLSDDELTRRIDKMMAVEAMSGILSDFTPEQIKSFKEALERK